MREDIQVCAGWITGNPVIGTYAVDRQNNVIMFRYEGEWLRKERIRLDPQLPLFA